MSTIYLLEPASPGAAWAPFAGATALHSLRAGGWSLRERWELALEGTATGCLAPHLSGPGLPGDLPWLKGQELTGPAWVVDATFAPRIPMRPAGSAKRLLHNGRPVAWRLDHGEEWSGPFTDGDGIVVEGQALRGAWDLLTALEQNLFSDTLYGLNGNNDPIPAGTIVLGNPEAIALRGAELEPGVILDARKGAIILEQGVQVRSGTRIEGPAWVREGTWLLGGAMRHLSVGPHCRLHGEISSSVFMGYANKSHDGFVGHSLIGRWVNLGAGTITSNLKNTYGKISLTVGTERIETGRTNLGALIGDHVKTAIGTLLPT